jgi:hypothetical protein
VVKPIDANGQLAFVHFRANTPEGPFRPAAINVLSLHAGRIVEMAAFLQPGVHRRFRLPEKLSRDEFGRSAVSIRVNDHDEPFARSPDWHP